jgi:hypothetical protein
MKESEYNNLLAELWEILLPSNGQLNLSSKKIIIENSDRLSNLEQRTKR